jgi:transposase
MVKKAELVPRQRMEIIRLNETGMTLREIANELGCSPSTVSYTLSKYKCHQTIDNLYRSGRKPISTPRDQRSLLSIVKKSRRTSSQQLALQWKLSSGIIASARTVRRVLFEHDYLWRPACKKPRLTKNHIKQRLAFCQQYKNWTNLNWRDMIFSDEMNIEVDMRKNRVMLRRTSKEKYQKDCIVERTKQGSGSIGLWACMTYDGLKFFQIFNGRLNSHHYLDILENCLMPTLDLLENKEFAIFQQDNAPCHTAHRINDFFKENNIKKLAWPANSPDLNCIENLWSWLDKKLQLFQIGNVENLRSVVSEILNNVPTELTQALVDSMPKRIHECLEAKGSMTHY